MIFFFASWLGSCCGQTPPRSQTQSIRHFLLRAPATADPFLQSGLGEAGVQNRLGAVYDAAPSAPARDTLVEQRTELGPLQLQMAAQQFEVLRAQSSRVGLQERRRCRWAPRCWEIPTREHNYSISFQNGNPRGYAVRPGQKGSKQREAGCGKPGR